MKTLINNTSNESNILNGTSDFRYLSRNPGRPYINRYKRNSRAPSRIAIARKNLLASKANTQMAIGQIPDLWNVCLDLFNTFFVNNAPYSALQFIPVLQKLLSIDQVEKQHFLHNPETRHVLIENDLLKVVLIHWKPREISSIHGHPSGGCVFKVLDGQVEELRYTTDASPKLLSSGTYMAGNMAYIDDNMGFHAVGNPFNAPAITIHAYTPGIKKSNNKK